MAVGVEVGVGVAEVAGFVVGTVDGSGVVFRVGVGVGDDEGVGVGDG